MSVVSLKVNANWWRYGGSAGSLPAWPSGHRPTNFASEH